VSTSNSTLVTDADVIIVGAGPAGMSAAIELANANCSVMVLDMSPAPGGQIYRAVEANMAEGSNTAEIVAALGSAYTEGAQLVSRFRQARSIDYRPDTTVWEVRSNGTVGWLRAADAGYVRSNYVLLANGAMERPTPFPGWTLPGVMTAGAVQTLLKAGRLKPTGRVVLAGTGPLIFLLAEQLRCLGVKPVIVARTDRLGDSIAAARYLRPSALPPLLKGVGWLARLWVSGVKVATGMTHLEAHGTNSVEEVSLSAGGRRRTYKCDLLVVHDGIIPSVDLAHSAGLQFEWDEANASWRPSTSTDGQAMGAPSPVLSDQTCKIRVTGDARRIGGAEAAAAHGRAAALAILSEMGRSGAHEQGQAQSLVDLAFASRPFLDAAFPPGLSAEALADETIVCRCEELTAGMLRAKIDAGVRDIDQLRGETRCGMGPCQGRNCMVTVSRLLASDGRARSSPVLPGFRARPPARPLPLGALASLQGLDPNAAAIMTLEDKPENSGEEPFHAS